MNDSNLSLQKKLIQYIRRKVTMDFCDPDGILEDIKDCLSDITEIISKLIEVRSRKSLGNINYSKFPPGWTKLCNIHQGVGKLNFLSEGVALQVRFSSGNSVGWIQRGRSDRVLERFCSVVSDLKITFFNDKHNSCRNRQLQLDIETELIKLIN